MAFAAFLPLFIGTAVLPYLHRYWHMASIYIVILAIPIMITFEELSSLEGIKYSLNASSAITQSYTSSSARNMADVFIKITAGTLVAVQLIVSLLCIRLTSHINHIHELGGSIPGITVKASVVFSAGAAIGALDSAFAFVPSPIFGTILFRRILNCLSRLLIIYSLIRCDHSSALFAIPCRTDSLSSHTSQHHTDLRSSDSPSTTMRSPVVNTPTPALHSRRRSGLLGLIGNPRYSTFAHLRGDNVLAAEIAEQRRRQQRVTVSYDHVNPPVLDVRFSQLGFPAGAVDRAIAHARNSVLSPTSSTRRPAPLRAFGSNGELETINEKPGSKPMLSPTISVRANASLYRHRPEYFQSQSQPTLPLPASLSQDSRRSRRRSSAIGALARTLARPASIFGSSRQPSDIISPHDSQSSAFDESYDRPGLLAQFPDTPKGSAHDVLHRRSEEDAEKAIPMPEPIHFFGGGENNFPRSRTRTQSRRSQDPFLDMNTPTDASSGEVMTAESRPVGVPLRERRSARDSFLDMGEDDHPPTPFDPNGYAAGGSGMPQVQERAQNPFTPEPRASESSQSSSQTSSAPRPSDVSENSSHFPPSQRRLDMRHQRVPTAELAPLNVFRDRLAERRRERSGHSGSSSSVGLSSSLSPPRSRMRSLSSSRPIMEEEGPVHEDVNLVRDALATMGAGVRTTVATVSTVASFFIGEPPVTDSSTTPHTNTLHPQQGVERSAWSETNESDVRGSEPSREPDSRGSDDQSVLAPPSMGQLSRVDSERTTPSPDRVPSQIRYQEQRGSVGYGYAR